MILLAISGGPDSMLLLNDYGKKGKSVVAHVNYHKREDSDKDEQIVREFCKKKGIILEVLSVKEKPKGNFQSWARKIRYEFFKKLYDKYECKELLIAHHKDDFIETALMQQRSGRTPRYFGIKKTNELYEMNIRRPFINSYYKDDILRTCEKEGIPYAIDSSNDQPIFERNKIRLELKEKSRKEKDNLFSWFKMSNKILKKKFKRVDSKLKYWEKTNWKLDYFRSLSRDREEVLYEFIHSKFKDVKLSSGKIKSLMDFIDGKEGNKNFKLNVKIKIEKQKGYLTFT